MSIAWFTPFGLRSAVAEYSKHVVEHLAAETDVVLYVDDAADGRTTSVATRAASDALADPTLLDEADVVVYNLGDHFEYHATTALVSRIRPGVVILHDRSYQNLYRELLHRNEEWPVNFERVMRFWYGEEGARAAADNASHRTWTDELVARFPLWEEAVAGAEGVCVHARDQAGLIRNGWEGPVGELFLPRYPTDPEETPVDAYADEILFVTVGYVNSNKRIDHVIRALGADPGLARRVRYVVAGPYDPNGTYFAQLDELIRTLGLGDRVELLGYQPDEVLSSYMARADAFVNLRYPTLEGGSASLMRQLALGKPVVAYGAGAFSEVPSDAIVLVPPMDDEALAASLRAVADDALLRARVGASARRWTEERDVAAYCNRFLEFLEEVGRARPLLRLTDRVATELAAFGVSNSLPVVERVAQEIATMRR